MILLTASGGAEPWRYLEIGEQVKLTEVALEED
jgi:hypothetical protein